MTALINVKELIEGYKKKLNGIYDQNELQSVIYILVEEYLGLTKVQVAMDPKIEAAKAKIELLEKGIDQIGKNIPVQYVIGKAWFHGMELSVNPSVLIPRQETELLIDWISEDWEDREGLNGCQVLDIGTGSGCIALALKKRLDPCKVLGVDVSEKALETAKKNAKNLNLNVRFSQLDLEDPESWVFYSKFNWIVSNPPYVLESEKALMKNNVLDYEPAKALFVDDEDPLKYYRLIVSFSKKYLKKEGRIYLEVNEKMAHKVASLLAFSGFCDVNIKKDLNYKDRFVRALYR